MKFPTALLLVLAATGCAKKSSEPAPVPMTYLLTAKVAAGPAINVGTEDIGTRIAYPLTGGTITGPAFNGTILPVGADFSLLTNNNKFSPDGISIFQTSDGANIIFRDNGFQDGKYVYGAGSFETGSNKYAWLNQVVPVTRALVKTGKKSTSVGLEIFALGKHDLSR